MKKKVKTLVWMLLGLVLAFLLTIAIAAVNIYTYGNESSHIQADAAIVLGAEIWGEEPSPVFRERINHAIALYRDNKVDKIIFTGGVGKSKQFAESVVAKNYAIDRGVKESDIAIETESRTTKENLVNAQKIIASHRYKKILIVSDPLHLKRSVLMARDLGMDAYPSPTPTTRYRSFNSKMEFLGRETYFYFVYLLLKS